MRERFEREKLACDAARAHYLSCGGGPGAAATQAAARKLASAKESLEAARARLTLATCNVEGRRRYVLLEAARETMTSLHKFFEDGAAAMGGLAQSLRALEVRERKG